MPDPKFRKTPRERDAAAHGARRQGSFKDSAAPCQIAATSGSVFSGVHGNSPTASTYVWATPICRTMIAATCTVWSIAAPAAPQEMLAGREKDEFIASFGSFCIHDQSAKYRQFERRIVELYCGCVAVGLSETVPKRLLENPRSRPWTGLKVRVGEICAARVMHDR